MGDRLAGQRARLRFLQRQGCLTGPDAVRLEQVALHDGVRVHELLEREGLIRERELAEMPAGGLRLRLLDLSRPSMGGRPGSTGWPRPTPICYRRGMRLYDSFGPNPRAVRMFLLEKGLTLPSVPVDLLGGENRRPPYTDRNPGGQVPALELDDGRTIAETVAIFEYLEDTHPAPPLVGTTPAEKAETRMWTRRVELQITEHLYNGFRYAEGIELFRARMRVLPEAADGLKAIVRDKLAWLDGLMAGKRWVAGDRFTIADIVLYAALDFGSTVGQPLDPGRATLGAWLARVAARPSAAASLHPQAGALGMRG